MLAYSLLPPLIVFAASLLRPMYFERYMLVFLPGFALLLAAAFDRLRGYRRWRVLVGVLAPLAAVVMVLPGYYAETRYATAADMRGMIGYLSALAAPDAAVVTNLPASDPTFGYYYRETWPLTYLPESQDSGQVERQTWRPRGSPRRDLVPALRRRAGGGGAMAGRPWRQGHRPVVFRRPAGALRVS